MSAMNPYNQVVPVVVQQALEEGQAPTGRELTLSIWLHYTPLLAPGRLLTLAEVPGVAWWVLQVEYRGMRAPQAGESRHAQLLDRRTEARRYESPAAPALQTAQDRGREPAARDQAPYNRRNGERQWGVRTDGRITARDARLGGLKICKGCGVEFPPKPGSAGAYCTVECYRNPDRATRSAHAHPAPRPTPLDEGAEAPRLSVAS